MNFGRLQFFLLQILNVYVLKSLGISSLWLIAVGDWVAKWWMIMGEMYFTGNCFQDRNFFKKVVFKFWSLCQPYETELQQQMFTISVINWFTRTKLLNVFIWYIQEEMVVIFFSHLFKSISNMECWQYKSIQQQLNLWHRNIHRIC